MMTAVKLRPQLGLCWPVMSGASLNESRRLASHEQDNIHRPAIIERAASLLRAHQGAVQYGDAQ
jgi:hypothetical protein